MSDTPELDALLAILDEVKKLTEGKPKKKDKQPPPSYGSEYLRGYNDGWLAARGAPGITRPIVTWGPNTQGPFPGRTITVNTNGTATVAPRIPRREERR